MNATVQYRVGFAKNDEAVEGPDDAALVVTVSAADAVDDATLSYMLGKLKATGDTGVLFAELSSGRAGATVARLSRRA
jgi:hypothetical protein